MSNILLIKIKREKNILKQLDLIAQLKKLSPLDILEAIGGLKSYEEQLEKKLIFIFNNLDNIMNEKIEREVRDRVKIIEDNEIFVKNFEIYKKVIKKLKK